MAPEGHINPTDIDDCTSLPGAAFGLVSDDEDDLGTGAAELAHSERCAFNGAAAASGAHEPEQSAAETRHALARTCQHSDFNVLQPRRLAEAT